MTKLKVCYTRKRKDFLKFFVKGDKAKSDEPEEVSFGHLKEAEAEAAASSYDGTLRTEAIPSGPNALYQYFLKVGTDHKGQFQCCHDGNSTALSASATFDFGSMIMPGLTAEVGATVTAETGKLAILCVLVHPADSNEHINARSVSLGRMIGSLTKAGLTLKANVGFELGSSEDDEAPDAADADEANASPTGATELLSWEWEAQAMASAELSLHGEWIALADASPRSHPRGSSAALQASVIAGTRSIKDVLTEQVKALTAAGAFGGLNDPIAKELKEVLTRPDEDILHLSFRTDPIETYCRALVDLYRRGTGDSKPVDGTIPLPVAQATMVGYLEQVDRYYPKARDHAARIVVADQVAAIEKYRKETAVKDDADVIEKLITAGRRIVDESIFGDGIPGYSLTLNALVNRAEQAVQRTQETSIMEYRKLVRNCGWALRPYLPEVGTGPCSLTMWGATGGASADVKASLKVSCLNAEATLAAAKYTGKRSGYRFQSLSYGTSKAKSVDNPVQVYMTQDTLLRYSETQFEALKLEVGVEREIHEVEVTTQVRETEAVRQKKWYHGLSYASAVAYWRPTAAAPVLVGSGHGYSFGRSVLLDNLLTYGPSKGRWSKDLAKQLHISRAQLEAFFMGGAWSLCWDLHHKEKQIQAQALLIETSFAAKPILSWKDAKKAEINEFLDGFLKAEDNRGKPSGSQTGPEPGTLEAIRIRYRIADDVEDSKTLFKLGVGFLGSSLEIEAASIRRAGSSGVVDLYTMWIDPRLAAMAKKPATLHAVPEQAVPPVVLFSL
ncbi:hypothetical protein [Nannocystis sp.]|uniref:hypothetical protein n=1 Tax=Nannocystis sp. TaxID=1962667 RepID=UPI0025FE266B|nr:hypothetical protein [Nannocystis sp.]